MNASRFRVDETRLPESPQAPGTAPAVRRTITITAVIPTRGRIALLNRALDSIRRQKCADSVEIIVIDDASDPALPGLAADVKVLRYEHQVGACAARNAGAREARGDLLLFMDDDTELVAADELDRAAEWFARRPKLGALGFRQLTPNGEVHYMQPVAAEAPVRTGLFFSYGCMVRRDAYQAVHGMNEEFGYYYEEVELSLKLFAAGHDVIYDPGIRVVHYQDELHRDWRRIHWLHTRNACLSYLVHYPAVMLPALFFKRINIYRRLVGRRLPRLADIWSLGAELFRRRGYIRRNRRPLRWSDVQTFHRNCGRALPLDSETIETST